METSFYNKTIYQKEFNHPAEVVWDNMNDISKIHCLLSLQNCNPFSEPIFHRGTSSKKLGSIFSFNLMQSLGFTFEVEKAIETDYWYQLQWKAYHQYPSTPLFLLRLSVHYITEKQCLVVNDLTQFVKYDFKFHALNNNFKIYKSIDAMIDNNDINKVVTGGIRINAPFLQMIRPLLDWKTLQLNIPSFCDVVEYVDDELKKGTLIRLQFNAHRADPNEIIGVTLKVIYITVQDNYFILRLETIQRSKSIPHQIIEYTLLRINDNAGYYVIKHIMTKAVSKTSYPIYKEKGRSFLRKLKVYIEKTCSQEVYPF